MHRTTHEDLRTALRAEAFAGAKYLCYAAQARANGHAALAALFERTAAVKHGEHFVEEATLTGLVGGDADNLRDSIAAEAYEVEVMYKRFGDAATAAGDIAESACFADMRRDGQRHLAAFQESLRELLEASQAPARAVPSRVATGT